ncbi:Hydrolase or metal-binding protein [Paraburkholderia caribensis]|uniref:recombination directionality factor n=1 Tax=Paraburkholderia caribensis TaxID=75105 RepID=UPI001CAD8D79|nr:hydrolase or metal-binding protein [Paraburkholderia caribensis]CAG9239497.1 Hydrolase or metal-binding protein [Paraburkholderia caribensis]
MIKGLSITPPVIGRISIGRVVENNGRRLPEKDDQFTVTTQIQNRDGWVLHPFDEALRKASGAGKLRSIPVKVLFNEPDLNLRAEYSLFDRETGRPVCVGNGESCRRVTETGIESLPCPSPDACPLGQKGGCKPYGRLNVVIGDDDELGSFIFRTTSFNSIRTLSARLRYFHAVSGGLLATMPMELKLRGKSTTQSHRSAIYYVDLVVQSGFTLEEAIARARELDNQRKASGFDQATLDEAARLGFSNGAFEESGEDVPAVVEEFYPESEVGIDAKAGDGSGNAPASTSLKAKLDRRVAARREEGQ